MYKTNLSVKIGALTLKNPVMPASGTFEPLDHPQDVSRLGAAVPKTIAYRKSPGNPLPRVAEYGNGMLNSIGIPSAGLRKYAEDYLPAYAALQTPVILSVSGESPEDYRHAVKLAAAQPVVSAIELNLSCPNIGSGLPFSSDARLMCDTIAPLRELTNLPLIAKLSPMASDICAIAKAAERCGMDALTLCNTFPAMLIDIETCKPVLGNGVGGMSGPAVKPLIMRIVYQVYKAVSVPILASGGIASRDDAIEYFLAGASAVQIGCVNFVKPDFIFSLPEELDDYLYARNIGDIRSLTGMAHTK